MCKEQIPLGRVSFLAKALGIRPEAFPTSEDGSSEQHNENDSQENHRVVSLVLMKHTVEPILDDAGTPNRTRRDVSDIRDLRLMSTAQLGVQQTYQSWMEQQDEAVGSGYDDDDYNSPFVRVYHGLPTATYWRTDSSEEPEDGAGDDEDGHMEWDFDTLRMRPMVLYWNPDQRDTSGLPEDGAGEANADEESRLGLDSVGRVRIPREGPIGRVRTSDDCFFEENGHDGDDEGRGDGEDDDVEDDEYKARFEGLGDAFFEGGSDMGEADQGHNRNGEISSQVAEDYPWESPDSLWALRGIAPPASGKYAKSEPSSSDSSGYWDGHTKLGIIERVAEVVLGDGDGEQEEEEEDKGEGSTESDRDGDDGGDEEQEEEKENGEAWPTGVPWEGPCSFWLGGLWSRGSAAKITRAN